MSDFPVKIAEIPPFFFSGKKNVFFSFIRISRKIQKTLFYSHFGAQFLFDFFSKDFSAKKSFEFDFSTIFNCVKIL